MPRRKSEYPFWDFIVDFVRQTDVPLQQAVEATVAAAVDRALKAKKLVLPEDWERPTEEELAAAYKKHHPRA